MRVISGGLKGRKIVHSQDKTTRPLKDMTKEAIFNIIEHSNKFSSRIKENKILDLFSGVGSFGLECISRGASHVSFVENYPKTLMILEKNLKNLNTECEIEIFKKNIYDNNFFEILKFKYDIIFLDPPFKEKQIKYLLTSLFNKNISKNNSLIILHRNKKENDDFPSVFKIVEEKIYGLSKIYFGFLN